jgi:hypothetical protein
MQAPKIALCCCTKSTTPNWTPAIQELDEITNSTLHNGATSHRVRESSRHVNRSSLLEVAFLKLFDDMTEYIDRKLFQGIVLMRKMIAIPIVVIQL